MLSLGFDTLIIDNIHCSDRELSDLFELFVPLGIQNFVFIHDFDFTRDLLSLTLDKFKAHSKHISDLSPRNAHVKICANLPLVDGAVDNPDLRRLRASNKNNSLFVSIPLFQDCSDNKFATDLNKLLYRKNLFPIFTAFDRQIKSCRDEFPHKLLGVKNCAFVFDIKFLFDPQSSEFNKSLLNRNIHILPSISHNFGDYAGVLKSAEHSMSVIGKSEYYKLCSSINRTSKYVGF